MPQPLSDSPILIDVDFIDVPAITVPDSYVIESTPEQLVQRFLTDSFEPDQPMRLAINENHFSQGTLQDLTQEFSSQTLSIPEFYYMSLALTEDLRYLGSLKVHDPVTQQTYYEWSHGVLLSNNLDSGPETFRNIEAALDRPEDSDSISEEQRLRLNRVFISSTVDSSVRQTLPLLDRSGILEPNSPNRVLLSRDYRWELNTDNSVSWFRRQSGERITPQNLTSRDMEVAAAFQNKTNALVQRTNAFAQQQTSLRVPTRPRNSSGVGLRV